MKGGPGRRSCVHNASVAVDDLDRLPAYFLRHWREKSISFEKAQETYQNLAAWGRTRFVIRDNKLFYPDLKHNTFGCVLRRTPIMAWALLEMLEHHTVPDVDIPVNCRDKPGSLLQADPVLAFSYTTGAAFSDIPLPDYTYWSLPYADLPPWPAWIDFTRKPENTWAGKVNKMIWVGSPTNPLRQSFQACAKAVFGNRLVHRMPDKDSMHELAWRCKPNATGVACPKKPPDWTPLQEQCRYRYIIHLPGISDWLEHFKHQLACGSVNIFLSARAPKSARLAKMELDLDAAQGIEAPASFEHFDFTGPLVRPNQHFVHIQVPAHGSGVCEQLEKVLDRLETQEERAKCVADEGQRLSYEMNMQHVYGYMAGVLTEASRRQQDDVADKVIRAERARQVTKENYFSFIPEAKRPWMEHIFVPWHKSRFEQTPLIPPRGPETSSGLFH